jgi:hypothetical protein
VAVDVADAAESGDDFLTDVATFRRADGVGFESGFGREGIRTDVDAPQW